MKVKTVVNERFQDYKKPSLFVATALCDWKCCSDAGRKPAMCQNSPIAQLPTIDIPNEEIFRRYISDPITQAIVIGGLEPLLQEEEVLSLVEYFRSHDCMDDIVIYTGYYRHEVLPFIDKLCVFENIIVKFGRFIPYKNKRYDAVLGVDLASDNQYAERIENPLLTRPSKIPTKSS